MVRILSEKPPPLEADRLLNFPHPRDASALIGHEDIFNTVTSQFLKGKLHHGALLTGPKGIGKATFAWKLARFLLAGNEAHASDMTTPLNRRITALSEPNLLLVRRGFDHDKKKHKSQIVIDDIREMKQKFALSAVDNSIRVTIIDAADEMNPHAANALLKILEEPPHNSYFLLISHNPSLLLPTLKSRVITYKFAPLNKEEMAHLSHHILASQSKNLENLAILTGGVVGQALRFFQYDALKLYNDFCHIFSHKPHSYHRDAAFKFASQFSGAANAEKFDIMIDLIQIFLSRLAHSSLAPLHNTPSHNEALAFKTLLLQEHRSEIWARAALDIPQCARSAKNVHLDPASILLEMLIKINMSKF